MRAVCTFALVGVSLLTGAARADEPLPPLSTSGPDVAAQGPVTPVVTGPKPPPAVPVAPPDDGGDPLRILHALVRNDARLARTQRVVAGGLGVGVGVLFMGGGTLLFGDAQGRVERSDGIQRAFGLGLVAGGGLTLLVSGVELVLPSRMENLDDRLAKIETDPSLPSVDKLGAAEVALTEAAQADRFDRLLVGAVFLVSSAASAMLAGGLASDVDLSRTQREVLAISFGLVSVALVARGIWSFVAEGPAERLLRTWQTGTGRVVGGLELAPTVVVLPGAVGAGVGGRF